MRVTYDLFRDDLISRDDILKHFKKSRQWIYNQYREGLPYMEVGNDRVTSQEDINKHFAKRQEARNRG